MTATNPASNTTPPPATPIPVPSPFAQDMKAHLLDLLFSAIDSSHLSYIDRSELLLFVSHEPYLESPHLKPVVEALLAQLSHDEDSHCSRREWHAAFAPFQPVDVTRLLVNLIRRLPLPRRRLQHSLTTMQQATTREDEAGGREGQAAVEHRMCVYMEDMLFHAVDASLDHRIDEAELSDFLSVDPFFAQRADEREAVKVLFKRLQQQRQQMSGTADGSGGGVGSGRWRGDHTGRVRFHLRQLHTAAGGRAVHPPADPLHTLVSHRVRLGLT